MPSSFVIAYTNGEAGNRHTVRVDPVSLVVAAVADHDEATLRRVLHPYLHWTDGPLRLRGRNHVLAHLATLTSVDPPASIELRDGQIYRWTG